MTSVVEGPIARPAPPQNKGRLAAMERWNFLICRSFEIFPRGLLVA